MLMLIVIKLRATTTIKPEPLCSRQSEKKQSVPKRYIDGLEAEAQI
jgi:hypothetical protein